jgi:hypothetical protein
MAWCIYAVSDWLRDAYDVQAWLRGHHLSILHDAAEIIALIGPVPLAVLGGMLGAVVALLLPLPNEPLQATAAPQSD